MIEVTSGVKTFNKSEDGNEYFYINGRKSNFRVKEFACNDGSDEILIDMELVEKLQIIRERVGKAVYINSGYRTESYNAKIGGATNSQHKLGKAADIRVTGLTPSVLAQYARETGFKGVGVYSWGVHVDTRTKKSYWNG